jgi:hypothetical protein
MLVSRAAEFALDMQERREMPLNKSARIAILSIAW